MSNLFCKESLERVSSPEQLNSYIRASTPSVWLILSAVMILLAGVCIWGVFGHLDTTAPALVLSNGKNVSVYVRMADAEKIGDDARLICGKTEGSLFSISGGSLFAEEFLTEEAMHISGFGPGERLNLYGTTARIEAGVYAAEIMIDRVAPISFILN